LTFISSQIIIGNFSTSGAAAGLTYEEGGGSDTNATAALSPSPTSGHHRRLESALGVHHGVVCNVAVIETMEYTFHIISMTILYILLGNDLYFLSLFPPDSPAT
jgi:hypothetical protein